jgi:dynein light chain Tctex-type 1
MEDFEGDDELVTEDLATTIKQSVETVLGAENLPFQPEKVNQWCQQIIDACLKDLIKADKPFKYVVTCIIMQKNGAGL